MADNTMQNADYAVKITADLSDFKKQLDEGHQQTKEWIASLMRATERWSAFNDNGAMQRINHSLSEQIKYVADTQAQYQRMYDEMNNIATMSMNVAKSLQPIKHNADEVAEANKRASTNAKEITESYKEAEREAEKLNGLIIHRGDDTYTIPRTGPIHSIRDEVKEAEEEIPTRLTNAFVKATAQVKPAIQEVAEKVKSMNEDFAKMGETHEATEGVSEMSDQVDEAIQKTSIWQALLNRLKIPDETASEIDGVTQKSNVFANLWKRITLNGGKITEESREIQQRIDEIRAKMADLSAQKIETNDYIWLKDQIAKVSDELSKYYDKQDRYEATGVKKSSQTWKNLQYDISTATRQLQEYKNEMSQMEQDGSAWMKGSDSDQYKEYEEELENLQDGLSDVNNTGEGVSLNIGEKLTSAFKKVVKEGVHNLQSAFKFLVNSVKTGVKTIIDHLGGFASKLKGLKSESNLLENVVKKVHGTFTSFISLLKTRIKRTFISAVFNDMKESVGNIARTSSDFNASISGMIASCKAFGTQIVAMVEPIITVVGPYLAGFVDNLTAIADKISQFTARLMGKDTYTKAEKGQFDYAKSLDKTTESTEKAEKATKKYQNTVLGFDQLHKLNGSSEGTDVKDTAEKLTGVSSDAIKKAQTQATALNDLADRIRKAIQEGRFRDAGREVGKAITDAFSWLKDVAGWEKNADKFTKKIQHVIDFINGIREGLDGAKIGDAIGDVVNTIINGFAMIVDPINGLDFYAWGATFGEILVNAIKTIDWELAGQAFINGLQGLLQFINGLLTTENLMGEIGTAFNKFLGGGIDALDSDIWSDTISNIINGFADLLTNAFNNEDGKFDKLGEKLGDTLTKTFEKIDGDKIKTALTTVRDSIFAVIKNLWNNLPVSDWSAGDWGEFVGNIINNFFKILENLFGDKSKAEEVGKNIAEFVNNMFKTLDVDQIVAGINAVVDAITTAINSAVGGIKWNEEVLPKLRKAFGSIHWGGIAEIIGVAAAPAIIESIPTLAGELVKLGAKAIFLKHLVKILAGGKKVADVAEGVKTATDVAEGAKTVEKVSKTKKVLEYGKELVRSPGFIEGAAISGAVVAGHEMQKFGERYQGLNGITTEMGAVMDSLAVNYFPEFQKELKLLTDSLENSNATIDEASSAYANFFKEKDVDKRVLETNMGSVMAEVGRTEDQMELQKQILGKFDGSIPMGDYATKEDVKQTVEDAKIGFGEDSTLTEKMGEVKDELTNQYTYQQEHGIDKDSLNTATTTLAGAFSDYAAEKKSEDDKQNGLLEFLQSMGIDLNAKLEQLREAVNSKDFNVMIGDEQIARSNNRGQQKIEKRNRAVPAL